MNRFLAVIAAVLIPSLAMAQWQVAPGQNTPRALNTPGVVMERANVDQFGNQQVVVQTYLQTPVPYSPALVEMTPVVMVTVLPTAMPTAFGTPQYAGLAGAKTYTVQSTFDQETWCAYGGATSAAFSVGASKTVTDNCAARGAQCSGAISCIHPANTPASGTLQIWGSK
jgi:hypothetical protein